MEIRAVARTLRITLVVVGVSMLGMRAATARPAEERVDRQTQVALAMDANPLKGRETFSQHCARCHGADAQGDANASIPALAGQRFAYLVRQLADFAGAERESASMHRVLMRPAVREPQSWVDIASYLNNIPARAANQTGSGEVAALGRGIFHEQCASCHGADASGDKPGFVPSLRHQHYGYLNKQMHKLGQGYRHNVDEDLVLFMRSFNERDMRGTADYLSRLQGPGTVHKSMRQDGVVVN